MKKKIISSIIASLCIALIACIPLLMPKTTKNETASANYIPNSPIGYYSHTTDAKQGANITLDEINGTRTFYLYQKEGEIDTYSIDTVFSVYKSHLLAMTDNKINEQEISYKTGSASNAENGDLQVSSVIKLTNNMIIAVYNGYVSASADAYYSSLDNLNCTLTTWPFNYHDKADKVAMYFYAFDQNDVNKKATPKSIAAENKNSYGSKSNLSYENAEFSNVGVNVFELLFTLNYEDAGKGAVSANYIQIKEPSVTFNTTDTAVPTTSVEQINTEQYVYTRNVKLSGSDADSGVQRIEVSYNDGEYETVKDYTKDLTFSNAADYTAKKDVSETYAIEKNGTYKFRTIDNVGNVSSEVEYTEEGIDRDAPTIEITGLDSVVFSTMRDFSFIASLIDDNLSPNYFSYKLTLNGAEQTSGEITDDNEYNFSVTDNGVYTLTISGVDEVGNKMEDLVYTLVVTDFGIRDCYTSAVIDYNADTQSNGLSNYTFHVEISHDDGTEPLSYPIYNGANTFTLDRSGLYNVTCKYYATIGGTNYYGGSKTIEIDNQFYALTTSAVNGTIDESTTLQRGEHTIHFNANEGYSLYTLTINGEVQSGVAADASSYTFNFDGETTVEVVFRKIVELEISGSYTYARGSLTLQYSLKTELEPDLQSQYSNDYITFTYFDSNNLKIENTILYSFNVGKYKVSYNIDTPLFVGSGEQEFEITPLSLEIQNVREMYKYTGSKIELVFDEVESQAGVYVKFLQNGEAAEFNLAGEYTYIVTTDNANYSVYAEGSAVILPNIKDISGTSVTYNGEEQFITFGFDGTEANVYAKYFLAGSEVTPKNAGTYTVKFYFMPGETTYELETETAHTLVISKAELTVTATSLEKEYDGEVPEVSVSAVGFVGGFTYSFELSHTLSENVGKYQIKIVRAEAEEFSNYNIIYVDGLVEITPKTVYVKSADGLSKQYGDKEEPEITAEYIYGVIEGDELGLRLYRDSGEAVGSYDIKAEITNQNYTLDFTKTQFIITKRLAIISVKNASKVYGDKTETYDFVRNDMVLPEDVEAVLAAIKRDAGEDVGEYKLYVDTSLLGNYIVITQNAKFTITKREIKVAANAYVGENAVIFGESKPLTYLVYDANSNGIMSDIVLDGSLERTSGEDVGTYQISIGTLDGGKNYQITSFESAVYEIVPRKIDVKANAATKVYGDADVLTYTVFDFGTDTALQDVVLSGSLARTAGEDVGTYQISIGTLDGGKNYEIASFETAVLEITKAELTIRIEDKFKGYGDADELLVPEIIGAKNGDELVVVLVRAEGEELGSYPISIDYDASSDIRKNYIVNFSGAYYTIQKTAKDFHLTDKTVTYSGSEQSIDELNIMGIDPSEITYVYSYYGQVIEGLPVKAGIYSVKAVFAGNEYFDAFETEEVTFTVEQKLIPITVKKLEFVYDGTAKDPEIVIGLEEDVNILVTYKDGKEPIEVGSYEFTITSNDPNYTCNITMTLKILPAFEKDSSDTTVSAGSVNFSNSTLEFVEIKNSGLKSIFSSSTDGRRCVSVYSFKNAEAHIGSNEVLKVSIKAKLGEKDVELYIVDKDGRVTPVSYELIDGYYVLQVNDVTASVLVTVSDKSATYIKMLFFVLVLLITYYVSRNIRKRKKDKFFRKNTSVRGITERDYAENEQIVESLVVDDSEYETKSLID